MMHVGCCEERYTLFKRITKSQVNVEYSIIMTSDNILRFIEHSLISANDRVV